MDKNEPRVTKMDVNREFLPMEIFNDVLDNASEAAKAEHKPVIGVVTGTKPDFYKQAPLVLECISKNYPVVVINTGQHFDELLGFGLKEFNLEQYFACNLNIRGDLMEKASELVLKFGNFGRYFQKRYDRKVNLLPIVHGDTLIAGVAPLAWVFGMGKKVAQNEAGLRAMAPEQIKKIIIDTDPSEEEIRKFAYKQFNGNWFIAREEPFPEQIDTWICSAGTKYFFAPKKLNSDHLLREGYPEESIFTVGNTVADALYIKRKEKSDKSIFDLYPELESGDWIRMDIHRRGNMTRRRFLSMMGGMEELLEKGHKVVLIMLNATNAAVKAYGWENKLKMLEEKYPKSFKITPIWQEYGHVVEFLDSGKCAAELTDSGSMQEELTYFPKVLSLTARLSTDRPETIFDAKANVLIPPVSSKWVSSMVDLAINEQDHLGIKVGEKEGFYEHGFYGEPGTVAGNIIKVLEEDVPEADTFPWLHHRLKMWKETDDIPYS